jgi:hypothetical protein
MMSVYLLGVLAPALVAACVMLVEYIYAPRFAVGLTYVSADQKKIAVAFAHPAAAESGAH